MNLPQWDTTNTVLVREELMRRVERDATSHARSARSDENPLHLSGGLRPMWVTAAVGLVVVLLTIAVVGVVHGRPRSGPPADPGLAQESALLLQQELPQPGGRVVHTWTQDSTDASRSFDFQRATPVVAGACSGGGAIAVIRRGATQRLDCTSTAVLQPTWPRDAKGSAVVGEGPIQTRIEVVSGKPRFVVRLWAVSPKALQSDLEIAQVSADVPASLRTCTTQDLTEQSSFAQPDGFQRGIVTITNRSSTDCAVRAWPTVQPLDATLQPIGPSPRLDQQRSLDGAEGDADASGRFPPARLAAGRHGYFITDFDTRKALQQQDQRAEADAAGKPGSSTYIAPADRTVRCAAQLVTALRLTVGPAVITTRVTDAGLGACSAVAQNLDTNPVVATKPSRG